MNTKTYRAESMTEALAAVKREFGRDAIILETRSVRRGVLWGLLGGHTMWEITACPNDGAAHRALAGQYAAEAREDDGDVLDDPPAPRRAIAVPLTDATEEMPVDEVLAESPPADEPAQQPDPIESEAPAAPAAPEAPAGPSAPAEPPASAAATAEAASQTEETSQEPQAAAEGPAATEEPLGEQVRHLHVIVEALARRQTQTEDRQGESAELVACRELLEKQDVESDLVDEILGELKHNLTGRQQENRPFVLDRLRDLILSRLPVAPPADQSAGKTGPRRVMLVGPTGVGKTTTIAKLAADQKLRLKRRVGLITLDTFRVAAVAQLRTYAEIIDVPLRVAAGPQELSRAVYALRGMDVVLIDTAGRSQNDQLRLGELRRHISAGPPDEVHLVLSAAGSRTSIRRALQQFGPLGATHVILSKLDEAESFGTILNVGAAGVAAFSYVTTGQEVPDDFSPADAGQLADWILGGTRRGDR